MGIEEPLVLASNIRLENRIAKSALSERLAGKEGIPNEQHVRLYEAWAHGGAGLIITGNVMIDRTAIGESGNVILEDDTHLERFTAWAASAKTTPLWMQINHPGRQSPRFLSREPVAPSAVGLEGTAGAFAKPRALESDEVWGIVERFARTAALAKASGFRGVQIHAAHGYLISQFLSPRTNLRDDDWGGTEEKRRRFLIEVVRAVKKAVGDDFGIAVKLNSADFQRGGFSEDASMAVVQILADEGIHLLEISGGTYEAAKMFEETTSTNERSQEREAFFIDYAKKVRAHTDLPLMVTGGFRTLDGMNAALASGAVDVIGMGRPLAVEPDLPQKLLDGRRDAAHPVRINTGVKKLDAIVQSGWYQAQLRRVSNGLAPKLNLSRAVAVYRYAFPEC